MNVFVPRISTLISECRVQRVYLRVCLLDLADLGQVLWPPQTCDTVVNGGGRHSAGSRCHFVWPGLERLQESGKTLLTPSSSAPLLSTIPHISQQQPLPETPHCPEWGIRTGGWGGGGGCACVRGVKLEEERVKLRADEVSARNIGEEIKTGSWQEQGFGAPRPLESFSTLACACVATGR